jgi:hypothetical protein
MSKDIRAEFEADPKVELQDYSGPFKPDLRLTDFSKEALAKMYIQACEYILAIIEFNKKYLAVNFGMEAIRDHATAMWGDAGFLQKIMEMKTEYMGISGNDIETLAKDFQLDATALPCRHFQCTFEMPSKDRFIYTFRKCRAVDVLEAVDEELLGNTCRAACPPAITTTAQFYNPDIETKILKMPPRTQQMKDEGICCQWEFTYKSK